MSLTTELANMTIEIWLGGQWLTNTTTDETRPEFSAVHPVPADSLLWAQYRLKPVSVAPRAYLPSNAIRTLGNLQSNIGVTVEMSSPVAVNETVSNHWLCSG